MRRKPVTQLTGNKLLLASSVSLLVMPTLAHADIRSFNSICLSCWSTYSSSQQTTSPPASESLHPTQNGNHFFEETQLVEGVHLPADRKLSSMLSTDPDDEEDGADNVNDAQGSEMARTAEPPASIETCLSAIETAQRMTRDLPEGILLAIAKAESGRTVDGSFGPWPWTLNIAGDGRFFASRSAALKAAHEALESGDGNVDLGCMQISETWHGWAFSELESMLDPQENASYAASFLMTLHATHGSWREAIAHYHSSNPARGLAYAERVIAFWRDTASGTEFIAEDDSLSDIERLSLIISDLTELTDIEIEYFLSVTISQKYTSPTVFSVRGGDGKLYVSLNDLEGVPFADPYSLPLYTYADTILIALDDKLFEYEFDEENFDLQITAQGDLFDEQVIRSRDVIRPEELTPRASGGHLNYTFSTNINSNGDFRGNALFGGVGYWGSNTFRSSFIVNDDLSWRRLSTNLTIDDFAKRRTLVLGDTTTPSGSGWGSRSAIFGLNWGTNNRLDPSFSTLPRYSVFGVSDIPSVARFIVDGEEIRRTDLDPGRYIFDDLPVPDQFGELTVSVEDLLGEVRLFRVPYIRIPRLYKPGLHTYEYGFGLERASSDNPLGGFGSPVAATTHRYGFTDTFTGEFHGRINEASLGVGITADKAFLEGNAFISSTIATSFSRLGPGYQAGITYGGIRSDKPTLFSGSLRYTSKYFYTGSVSPVGRETFTHDRWAARLTSSLGGRLPISFNYSFSEKWSGEQTHSFSAGRSFQLGNGWSISTSGSYSFGSQGESARIFLSLNRSFGADRPVNSRISTTYNDGSRAVEATLQRSKPVGRGLGYYVAVSGDPDDGFVDTVNISADGEEKNFTYRANATMRENSQTFNAGLSGAIGFLGGETFFSSSLDSPYVLVRSGEAENLPIFLNHDTLGDTGSRGQIVGDGLVPFSRNRIEFKPEDLDFDFSISGIEYIKTIVPPAIGGYIVEFDIIEQFPAVVILLDSTGEPLPAGSTVVNLATDEVSGVTMGGMVYFESISSEQKLEADLGRFGTCTALVIFDDEIEKFDTIGPFACE